MSVRVRVAIVVTALINQLSRRLGFGSGTVAGGRIGLAIAPEALSVLGRGRTSALVSGTNGKTTTTRLLAAALEVADASVLTNTTGSNMPAGHLAALVAGGLRVPAVLEVDEGYLSQSVRTLEPSTIVLLNLSRDQLDRSNEVRMIASRWRSALEGVLGTVVANADDPLVTFGAGSASSVLWVAGGLRWRADAAGCPACQGRIRFCQDTWSCGCGFARPTPDVTVQEHPDGTTTATFPDGRPLDVVLSIPGSFNRRNAVAAAAAASVLGISPEQALEAMGRIEGVAGRFSLRQVGGVQTRLLLAKNPAGWEELLHLVAPGSGPVVLAINAREADGRDPSWLFDVAFERLAGRPIVATGERSADLSVRLHYGGLAHERVRDLDQALALAGRLRSEGEERPVDFIGNYTAFHDLLKATGEHRR